MPSSTGTSNSSNWPSSPGSPRKTLRCASGIGPPSSVLAAERGRAARRASPAAASSSTAIAPSAARATTLLTPPHFASSVAGIVEAAVGAAALGPLAGAAGDRLGHGQQVAELEDEVPARVVGPPAGGPDRRQPRAELGQLAGSPRRGRPPSRKIPTRRCIISCRSRWMAYGSSPSVALERRRSSRGRSWTWTGSRYGSAARPRRGRAAAAPGPGPEHQQVRQRVAAEPVGAVHPAGDLAGREQAGHGRRAGLGIDPDAAHDVVGRRADLHRPRRDVDVGELLELLVHRGQLAPHVVGRQVADVEEDAAVGRAAALPDLGVDRPRDVVAGRQLGRPPGVGLACPATGR